MKTKYCDDCKHVAPLFTHAFSPKMKRPPCDKGHRPKFFQPKSMGDAVHGRYGFKRRCLDFEGVNA